MQRNIDIEKIKYIVDMTEQLSLMAKSANAQDLHLSLIMSVNVGKIILEKICDDEKVT